MPEYLTSPVLEPSGPYSKSTADPWVHFGDGSAEFEYYLPAGPHTLTLQIGDGEHRTLDEPGLCNIITVTAEESDSEH